MLKPQEILNQQIPWTDPKGVEEGELFDSNRICVTKKILNAFEDYTQQTAIDFAVWISREGYLKLIKEANPDGWFKIGIEWRILTTEEIYLTYKSSNNG